MAQKLDLKIAGLYTNPNSWSESPEGSLATAANIVINRESVAETRRGQKQYNAALLQGLQKLFQFQSTLILQYGGTLNYDGGAGLWVDFGGTWLASSDSGSRGLEANRNLYLTSNNGIIKIDSLTEPIKYAGAPRGLNGEAFVSGAGNAVANNTNVAYRIVWGYDDANGNRILGAPSQRILVANSAGSTQQVSLNTYIPPNVTTSWFYQLYRSPGSATLADQPSDELQQVLSGSPTGTDLTAGTVSLTDNLPPALMGAALYTNPSQEGINSANEQPPYCLDIELYKGHTFFGNTKRKHSLIMNLVGVGTPSFGVLATTGDISTGLATVINIPSTANLRIGMRVKGTGIPLGTKIKTITSATAVVLTANSTATTAALAIQFCDTLTIAGVEYFGSASGVLADGEFRIYTGGNPSENIQQTVENFIVAVNGSAQNSASSQPVFVYYLSGPDDFPGQFQIEERVVNSDGGDPFKVLSTYGVAFNPVVPQKKLITNVATGSPTVITCPAHGLSTGDRVQMSVPGAVPGFSGAFTVTVTGTNTFTVAVNTTTGATYGTLESLSTVLESSDDRMRNRLYFSKPQQPEAVPILQYLDCGSAVFDIWRIAAQGESLFVFKDDGIFRVTGDDIESFRVSQFDNTTKIIGPETLAKVGNQLFFYSSKGVSVCSESGVALASNAIEDQVVPLYEVQDFTIHAFGIGYESEKQYMLFSPSITADESATQAYVYSLQTNAWTRWVMERTGGIVNTADNKLYMCGNNFQTYVERKDYASTDYCDDEFAVTIVSAAGTDLILASTTNIAVNDTLKQGNVESVVTAVVNGTTIQVQSNQTWVAGAATVYRPIEASIEWIPQSCGNPGVLKHFREITMLFRSADFSLLTVGFGTNFTNDAEYSYITPLLSNTWGNFPWGGIAWGAFSAAKQPQRTYVPRNASRAHWLTISMNLNQAFQKLDIEGLSLIYDVMSERFK